MAEKITEAKRNKTGLAASGGFSTVPPVRFELTLDGF